MVAPCLTSEMPLDRRCSKASSGVVGVGISGFFFLCEVGYCDVAALGRIWGVLLEEIVCLGACRAPIGYCRGGGRGVALDQVCKQKTRWLACLAHDTEGASSAQIRQCAPLLRLLLWRWTKAGDSWLSKCCCVAVKVQDDWVSSA